MRFFLFLMVLTFIVSSCEKKLSVSKSECAYCNMFEEQAKEYEELNIKMSMKDSIDYKVHQITNIHLDSVTQDKLAYDINFCDEWKKTSEGKTFFKEQYRQTILYLEYAVQEAYGRSSEASADNYFGSGVIANTNANLASILQSKITEVKAKYKEEFGEDYN